MSGADARYFVALAIFVVTYGILAFRNVKGWKIPIWLILLIGAAAMVASGSISVARRYKAVDLHVILFLFSMFVLVTRWILRGFWMRSQPDSFLGRRNLRMSCTSHSSGSRGKCGSDERHAGVDGNAGYDFSRKKMKISPKPLLLTLAFAVTIGSTVTPMGNPQNLLVALASGMRAPVLSFAEYLLVPTIINLVATYILLRYLLRHEFAKARRNFPELIDFEAAVQKEVIKDRRLAKLSVAVTSLTIVAIFLVNVFEQGEFRFRSESLKSPSLEQFYCWLFGKQGGFAVN